MPDKFPGQLSPVVKDEGYFANALCGAGVPRRGEILEGTGAQLRITRYLSGNASLPLSSVPRREICRRKPAMPPESNQDVHSRKTARIVWTVVKTRVTSYS